MKRNRISSITNILSVCLCCLILSSCISLPGEKELEEKNLAAEYYEIALKYVDVKQYDKAITCFQKARDKSDKTIQIDYQIARTYALSNKWKEASDLFESLLSLDSANSTLKEDYAYTLYKSGEKEKALQLYAELCELNEGNERLAKNYEALLNEKNAPTEEEAELNQDTPEEVPEQPEDQEAIGS